MLAHLDRTPGLQVDLLGPVRRHVFVGAEQRAVGAIEHIGEAVAVEVREHFDLLAVDVHVGEDVLVDAVIVPLIEGRHLIGPDGLAGLDLAGENGQRPLVVELAGVALLVGLVRAAERWAPQAGVAGRVVDELVLGIVAVPAPSRAAADLPVLAGEGLDAEILAGRAVMRVGLVGVGGQAHVLVGTRRVALPNLRAVLKVVGGHAAAGGELVAAEADDHLVVGDQRSRRDGLALLGLGVLDDPDFLTGLAIERDDEAVEGADTRICRRHRNRRG